MALVLQHAVEALGVEAAGVLVRRFAVAPLDFRQVRHVDLRFPHGFVGLLRANTAHEHTQNTNYILCTRV